MEEAAFAGISLVLIAVNCSSLQMEYILYKREQLYKGRYHNEIRKIILFPSSSFLECPDSPDSLGLHYFHILGDWLQFDFC